MEGSQVNGLTSRCVLELGDFNVWEAARPATSQSAIIQRALAIWKNKNHDPRLRRWP
ncbi:hypothetical protein CPC08DRAFT_706717 [Agrocybe pediades]|nr:hypothetical protein CPC08DRAFT_706717 [Agrocybe pediades]